MENINGELLVSILINGFLFLNLAIITVVSVIRSFFVSKSVSGLIYAQSKDIHFRKVFIMQIVCNFGLYILFCLIYTIFDSEIMSQDGVSIYLITVGIYAGFSALFENKAYAEKYNSLFPILIVMAAWLFMLGIFYFVLLQKNRKGHFFGKNILFSLAFTFANIPIFPFFKYVLKFFQSAFSLFF